MGLADPFSIEASVITRPLLRWYESVKRDLPWRHTQDPYRIWISEIMLQQTRVAAVIPYYEAFLARFPAVDALAAASESELLTAWSGLGYYSRARNMQAAAKQIVANGGFPTKHKDILRLAGVGTYTAAAIASIAFGLPHAVLDGNVLRVLSRVRNDAGDIGSAITRKRLQLTADELLDRNNPASFNQALMELGATVCLPRDPRCLVCPITSSCEARRLGLQNQRPVKQRKMELIRVDRRLLVVRKNGRLLLWKRSADSKKLAGFWELPEPAHCPDAVIVRRLGSFRHSITNHVYTFEVDEAELNHVPPDFHWWPEKNLHEIPLSTTAKKSISCLERVAGKLGEARPVTSISEG